MQLTKMALIGARTQIESDIRKGFFTPFLGAGASSLRSGQIDPDSYPWRDVARTLTAIAARLTSAGSLDFVRSFAAQRLRISEEVSKAIVPAAPLLDRPDLWPAIDPKIGDSILVMFQVEIVRAAARLTKYFGMRFADESPSIHRLEDCSVAFDLRSVDAVNPLVRLLAATDIALEMREGAAGEVESPFLAKVPDAQRGLDRQGIHEGLLALIVGLMGTQRPTYEEQLAKHDVEDFGRIPDEVDGGTMDDFGRLRLDAIQWMSELLWYTLRYWVPWYPTTAELAFELSLAVRGAPPRRAELAQAAQAFENDFKASDLSTRVGDLVTYCEKVQERHDGPSRETAAFYYGIAAVLQHQFDMYKKELSRERRALKDKYISQKPGEDPVTTGGNGRAQVPVPLAFTTNFDSALEKIFDESNLSFHIVFPVVKSSKKEEDEETAGAPIWMIKTCHPRSERKKPEEEEWEFPDAGVMPLASLEGPIIVKLHGSPGMQRDGDVEQHWVVLSEVGYLQALTNDSWAPKWLVNQLRWNSDAKQTAGSNEVVQRALWFLGYSISDWNVRLRLYEHCKRPGGSRNTVDRAADVYRTAILRHLEVAHCVGDLNKLPGMIFRAFDDDDMERSPEVKYLLEKLKHLKRAR
jgi:SIR2-like domain